MIKRIIGCQICRVEITSTCKLSQEERGERRQLLIPLYSQDRHLWEGIRQHESPIAHVHGRKKSWLREEHCSDAAQQSSGAVDGVGLVPKGQNPVNCCNCCYAG